MLLEDIIISRVRVKILTLFLDEPGKMYHVRDIVRQVGEEINAVRRELLHLEEHGMMTKEHRANRLFYSFRKDYPLYFEFIELIAKTVGLGSAIIKNKAKLGKLKYVMIAGRFIRNTPKKSKSDIDMLIVGSVVLPELTQIVKAEELRRGREMNYTVMPEEEFEYRKRRRDPFIGEVLLGPRVMIVGDEDELVH